MNRDGLNEPAQNVTTEEHVHS